MTAGDDFDRLSERVAAAADQAAADQDALRVHVAAAEQSYQNFKAAQRDFEDLLRNHHRTVVDPKDIYEWLVGDVRHG